MFIKCAREVTDMLWWPDGAADSFFFFFFFIFFCLAVLSSVFLGSLWANPEATGTSGVWKPSTSFSAVIDAKLLFPPWERASADVRRLSSVWRKGSV